LRFYADDQFGVLDASIVYRFAIFLLEEQRPQLQDIRGAAVGPYKRELRFPAYRPQGRRLRGEACGEARGYLLKCLLDDWLAHPHQKDG
jgi:hypothetical protein